jgi:hypothetical protein
MVIHLLKQVATVQRVAQFLLLLLACQVQLPTAAVAAAAVAAAGILHLGEAQLVAQRVVQAQHTEAQVVLAVQVVRNLMALWLLVAMAQLEQMEVFQAAAVVAVAVRVRQSEYQAAQFMEQAAMLD